MKKFVSLDKRSKKAQKEYYSRQRLTWGVLNPVTRSVPSGKTYNREKDKQERRRIGKEFSDGFEADFFDVLIQLMLTNDMTISIILNIKNVIQRGGFVKNLIKKIRSFLNMSQTEFAELLNISFATVNRWENGRAVPNKLAQSILYELCKINNVPVYDMVLDKIKEETENIKIEDGRVLLYHGSKSGIKGDIEPKSRSKCDFGKGFYMGTEPAQALTLICDYDKSKFYIVSVAVDELEPLNVPADLEWAMLVAYHRGRMDKIKGTSFYNKYRDMMKNKDIIIGSIADDRMFYVIDNFFLGNITDAALVNSLSALELGKQYVAITQKACNAVKIECEIELSYLERQFMKDIAGANRTKGTSLANEICKNYRREGMFFDEILDAALKED